MKADELMVGDWISYRGIVNKVAPADFCQKAWIDEIEPILLTAEILEKNGFENGKLNFNPQYYLEYNNIFIGVTLRDIPDKHKGIDIAKGKLFFQYDISYIEEPMYVHQLQHALRLCGIDKEIKL